MLALMLNLANDFCRHDRFASGIDMLRRLADPERSDMFDEGIAELVKSMGTTLANGVR